MQRQAVMFSMRTNLNVTLIEKALKLLHYHLFGKSKASLAQYDIIYNQANFQIKNGLYFL